MHESFNKHLREPHEDLKIRNHGSYDEEGLQDIIDDFVEMVKNHHIDNEAQSLNIEQEFGPVIWEKISSVFSFALTYFRERGIAEVKFNPFFLMKDMSPGKIGANRRSEGITLADANIDQQEIRQLQFLKTFAHELYHSSAAVSLTVHDTWIDDHTLERSVPIQEGAGYYIEDFEKTHALEEGLASRFEEQALVKIKEMFSEEVLDVYESYVSQIMEKYDNDLSNRTNILLLSLEDHLVGYATNQYRASQELVMLLAAEIPNFDALAEEARLKRHTLPLARAIEKRFGKGTYRQITTCTTDDARNLCAELMKR